MIVNFNVACVAILVNDITNYELGHLNNIRYFLLTTIISIMMDDLKLTVYRHILEQIRI